MGDLFLPSHLILVAVFVILYFMPVIVARVRSAKSFAAIAIINIFLGWTFVGWVVALAWAASGKNTATTPITEISHAVPIQVPTPSGPGSSYRLAKAFGSAIRFKR